MTETVDVLLVEDNDADARYVEELFREPIPVQAERFPGLSDAGNEVQIHRETSLAGTTQMLESSGEMLDVVLLDLHIEDSGGMETLEGTLAASHSVPVVVLTGVDDTSVGAAAIRAGAQDYLVKDEVTRDLLERTIRYAIQRHETGQALRERTEQLAIMNQLTRHDVRNDISLVVARARQLRKEVDERYADTLTEIITASNHVLQLTRTIGDAVEAADDDPDDSRLGAVSLARILEDEIEKALDLYEPAEIEISGDYEDVEVWGDSLLGSVFGNIISNAIIYNDEQTPQVDVTVTVEGETVTVDFADNGPGISPRQRRELFSSESSDLDGSGLGIGLFLVRRLVDRYDGEIDISDNQPKGSVFSVELQRA
ncbi:ATP-binding response regulator [Haloarcula amylovorans]|uniref:ATP-binding response regulator n=1 Tax=Haloarcula amylovorans TaxID=2562280 RepID=UPI0010769EF4|nr:ATP-binding protein [Halomicroarcula amylolytica]